MKQQLQYLGIIVCAIFLSSCISLSVPKQSTFQKQSALAHMAQVKKIKSWNLTGALSISQAGRRDILNYQWQQTGSVYTITLASVLNLKTLTIYGKPGYACLNLTSHQRLSAKTPEGLVFKATKLHLPISNLYYWIRGLKAPGEAVTQFDQYGHLVFLSQSNWTIQFSRYRTIDGIDLPGLMSLKAHDINIKIALKVWTMPT